MQLEIRVMIDTNVVDAIVDDDAFRWTLLDVIEDGRLEVVITHIQVDELRAIGDDRSDDRWALVGAMNQLDATSISTYGFVLNLSRLNLARLTNRDEADRHMAFVGQSKRRAKDALLLATAEREGLPFVTNERKPRNMARWATYYPTVEIWTFDRFRTKVIDLAGQRR